MNSKQIRNNLIAQRKAFLANAREDFLRAKKAIALASKVSRAVSKALGRDVEVASYYTGLAIDVHEEFADGFKDARLIAVLEALLDAIPVADIATHDYPQINLREYVFRVPGLRVEINARLPGEGAENCRRIKVGEEVRIVDKYEFVCE